MTGLRIGQGFDVHRFCAGGPIRLCGVDIDSDHGLEGHSDADVALHAITDAILGALAAGDIGEHFPPSDPRWQGVASDVFVRHALKIAAENDCVLVNCDLIIIAERPKIGPHRGRLRASLAEILEVPLGRVSVKATTTEGLGFTGREEGLAAMAVVLIEERDA